MRLTLRRLKSAKMVAPEMLCTEAFVGERYIRDKLSGCEAQFYLLIDLVHLQGTVHIKLTFS